MSIRRSGKQNELSEGSEGSGSYCKKTGREQKLSSERKEFLVFINKL